MGSCRSETKAKKALDITRHENSTRESTHELGLVPFGQETGFRLWRWLLRLVVPRAADEVILFEQEKMRRYLVY
jgi:hypothetical protein